MGRQWQHRLDRMMCGHINWDRTFRRLEKSWLEVEHFLEKSGRDKKPQCGRPPGQR